MNPKLLTILAIGLCSLAHAQTVTYTAHNEVIANPERGFYHHTEVHSGSYENLSATTLSGYRTSASITQILRVFYLEEFKESPISTTYLNNMRKDFAAVREAGIKVIVRFAYTTSSSAPYGDATPEMVLTHINQLTPLLRENADVIEVVQAGFIGAWGEWYYTDYFAENPGLITESDWENRRKVVYGLLDALPADRMVQLRTPGYKMQIFETEDPLNETTAYSGTYSSRTGHHNDCFVASSSDYGTYVNPTIEKPYLEAETFYTPMGGETCALASPYSDCENSLSDLQRFHWSFLNIDYNTEVLNEWDSQGCFDEIELNLGYRYELLNGNYTASSKPGGTFSFSLNLQNVGYSNPYNPRPIEIILRNQEDGTLYKYESPEDLRLWDLGVSVNFSFEAGLPADMTSGNYDLILNLPDAYATIDSRPAYSIRMANAEVWEEATGYNVLLHTLNVSSANTADTYMGSSYFTTSITPAELNLDGSMDIFGRGSADGILTYWGSQDAGYTRILQRSVNGNYETVASLPGNQPYYLDTEVSAGSAYTYRYYLMDAAAQTEYSETVTLSTTEDTYPTITVDGGPSDWGVTTPLANVISGNTEVMTVHFDAQNINLLLEGAISSYALYFNIDNDATTGGSPAENITGMDYLFTNGVVYAYDEEWIAQDIDVLTATSADTTELSFPFESMDLLAENQIIPTYVIIDQLETYPTQAYIYRSLPASLPANFAVRKSENYPQSRLVISWEKCENCTGYVLQHSTDNETFSTMLTASASTILAWDENLEDQTTYYYRIASVNEIGTSAFSESISETTGIVVLSVENVASVYPNPTTDVIYLKGDFESVKVYSLSGQLMIQAQNNPDQINLQGLQKGMYLLILESANKSKEVKVIKQ